MNIFLLCASVIGILIISTVIKKIAPDWALFVALCLGILVLRYAIGYFYPVFAYVEELFNSTEYTGYFAVIVKTLGIATITFITCELCRDLGENALAAKVELCGKAAILLCGLPVIKQLFTYINSFIKQ